jgi:hypothetical protein
MLLLYGCERKDLDVLVKAHWQMGHLEKSADPDAAIAFMAGTSIRQVKNVLKKPTAGPSAPVRPLRPAQERTEEAEVNEMEDRPSPPSTVKMRLP